LVAGASPLSFTFPLLFFDNRNVSVLSALEGIETQSAGLTNYVVLITVVIIFALFMAQRFGTSKIGASFGPIMLLWFFSIAIYGIIEVCHIPATYTQ
jgi:KUP system potassium uptake protein